jgi:hypothetical protein
VAIFKNAKEYFGKLCVLFLKIVKEKHFVAIA